MASEDIVQLEFPQAIRKRYGMYVGSVENASVIEREAIDNSVDELYADVPKDAKSPCDTVWINYKDDVYSVADNCRGIPTKESPQKRGWTMARLAVSSLHAGSKFDNNRMTIGTNGVGVSCTNALSESFSILSRMILQDKEELPKKLREECPEITDSLYYFCRFERGILKEEGFREFEDFKERYGQYPSTITTFKPDMTIFKSGRAHLPTSLPYVNYILNHRGRKTHIFVNGKEYKDSLQSYGIDFTVKIPSNDPESLNKELTLLVTMGFQPKLDPCEIVGSVNGLDCAQGFHIRLFQNAFDKAFKEVFSDCKRYEFMGMRMAVIALCNEPTYSSQTKERLADVDGFKSSRDYELNYIGKELKKLFKKEEYYSQFKNHELKILEYMKSTEKLGRKEFIKSTVLIASQSSRSDAMVPEKLIDCSSTNRHECELYLCEGNSAGGSLVKCRDPRIHAVLPLRGKVLNTTGLEIEQVLTNREMKDLISAIGVGVNDYHDMSEVRYGKVIIVADSDPDGLNIDALCLGALATHLTFLVEAGCVYVARSPLFKQGDKYYLDGSKLDRTKPYSRFKGLGEANPEDLAPFVFDKNTRELIKITMDNWEDARDMLTSASAKREVMYQHNVISEDRVEFTR